MYLFTSLLCSELIFSRYWLRLGDGIRLRCRDSLHRLDAEYTVWYRKLFKLQNSFARAQPVCVALVNVKSRVMRSQSAAWPLLTVLSFVLLIMMFFFPTRFPWIFIFFCSILYVLLSVPFLSTSIASDIINFLLRCCRSRVIFIRIASCCVDAAA